MRKFVLINDLENIETTDDVKKALETAAYVDRLLPAVKSPKYKNCMPEIIYTPQELMLMDVRPTKIKPTREQINLWEKVTFEWLCVLDCDERRLVWKRANKIPWKLLCREFHFERAEMWRRYNRSLIKVLSYIKGINVGYKKV